MPSIYNSNAQNIISTARKQTARNLLAATVYFQTHLMMKLGERTPNYKDVKIGKQKHRIFVPPFSLPGEYPMKRTGFLQASILFEPSKPAEVEKTLKVRVGYSYNAFYGAILEFKLMRAGLMKTLEDLSPYLEKLAVASLKI